MSLASVTKLAGDRPPTLPPIRTTFDGSSDGGDPAYVRIRESVMRLVALVDTTPDESLDSLLSLLQQRRRWVDDELRSQRLVERVSLPPPILGLTNFDAWDEEVDRPTRALRELDDVLDRAIRQVRARIWVQSLGLGPSDE